jgi:hypothetical protein
MKNRRLTSILLLLVLLATVVSASAIDPEYFDRNRSRYFWTRDYYMDNGGKVTVPPGQIARPSLVVAQTGALDATNAIVIKELSYCLKETDGKAQLKKVGGNLRVTTDTSNREHAFKQFDTDFMPTAPILSTICKIQNMPPGEIPPIFLMDVDPSAYGIPGVVDFEINFEVANVDAFAAHDVGVYGVMDLAVYTARPTPTATPTP